MPSRSHGPAAPALPASLDGVDAFTTDLDWYGLRADSTLDVPDTVYDLVVDECLWQGVDLSGRSLAGLRARDVLFDGCDLSGAMLDGATLDRVTFRECRMTGVVLSGGALTDVVVSGGVADLTMFRSATCTRLWVIGATLKSADFYHADLRDCALLDADLSDATFEGASVRGLSLHGSRLDTVRGASAFGPGVGIDADQAVPLGAALLAGTGITVTERPG